APTTGKVRRDDRKRSRDCRLSGNRVRVSREGTERIGRHVPDWPIRLRRFVARRIASLGRTIHAERYAKLEAASIASKQMEIIIACKTCGLVQRVDELQPDTAAEAKKEWLEWAPEIRISR